MAAQGKMTGEQGGHAWRIVGWSLAAALLLTPLVAMQFTADVRWSAGDFLVAALLIGGLGLAIEGAVRRSSNVAYRAGAALAAFTAFALVWVNLAVGVIGDAGNPANLLFAGVLAVALLGSLTARLRPQGLAMATAAAALAQALVAAVAFVTAWATPSESGLALAFALPWVLSAGLFLKASRT